MASATSILDGLGIPSAARDLQDPTTSNSNSFALAFGVSAARAERSVPGWYRTASRQVDESIRRFWHSAPKNLATLGLVYYDLLRSQCPHESSRVPSCPLKGPSPSRRIRHSRWSWLRFVLGTNRRSFNGRNPHRALTSSAALRNREERGACAWAQTASPRGSNGLEAPSPSH